jgi:low affinity Fe/Cu permease
MSMPSGESRRLGLFDRFASAISGQVSRAPFFAGCVALVLIWAPSYFLIRNLDTWQLLINTATTIVTFLLVALLQNTQYRADAAVQQKLNAIAQYLLSEAGPGARQELRAAIGVEDRESSEPDEENDHA